jgi:hypothetical protein
MGQSYSFPMVELPIAFSRRLDVDRMASFGNRTFIGCAHSTCSASRLHE